jgi:predicted GIY-YIG superfamily endonuclease
MSKQPAIYILTNKKNGTLYTGVTSNPIQRIHQHKAGDIPGFSAKYGCNTLVYYEPHETMESAILREKQLKGGSRQKKLARIESINPGWKDLYPTIL